MNQNLQALAIKQRYLEWIREQATLYHFNGTISLPLERCGPVMFDSFIEIIQQIDLGAAGRRRTMEGM